MSVLTEALHCGPMKLGKCYVKDVIGIDLYQEIQDFSGDVLIVHGTKDNIVDIEYSKRVYELYLENKGKKDEPGGCIILSYRCRQAWIF